MPGTSLLLMVFLCFTSISQLARSPNWLCVPFPRALGVLFPQPCSLISHKKKTWAPNNSCRIGVICENIVPWTLFAWWFDETFKKIQPWKNEDLKDFDIKIQMKICIPVSDHISLRPRLASWQLQPWLIDFHLKKLAGGYPKIMGFGNGDFNISWCIFVKFHQVYCISILLKVMWGTSQTCTCKCQRSKT